MAPRISSYMKSLVYVVSPNDSLAYARNYMMKKEISRVVVIDNKEIPIGILTISDIVEALFGKNYQKPLDSILVNEVMTHNPIIIEESKSIKTAALLMLRHRIGGLPVVDNSGKLIGIITKTDIAKAFYDKFRKKFIASDIMRKDFTSAKPGHSIFYIARLLESDPAGKVIILDDNKKLIGVIAKKDLAYAQLPLSVLISRGKDRYIKTKVPDIYKDKIVSLRMYLVPIAEDIMSSNPLVIKSNDDAASAAYLIVSENIGVLPVVNENNSIEGIITKIEFLNVISKT
ncbi:MAG: inosine-5-monophosphate dehydrogenase [Caldisphaera sp.]|nr:MAG: inosine-5-monophosphate dehydrogenase [Caldisphaera sp.]PMP92008.1 MAG: inosine-5-monophosphate dehydrogenase [Caldisphaera sp.]